MKTCVCCDKVLTAGDTARATFHLEGLESGPGRPPGSFGNRTWDICRGCGQTLRVLMATHGPGVLRQLVQSMEVTP